MFFSLLAALLAFLLDLVTLACTSDQAKDLELLLLRQQVRILQRKQPRRLHISVWEKLPLAVVTVKFRHLTNSTACS